MDIKEIISSRKYEEALAIEKVHFVKTDRMVNPKKVSPFKHWEGVRPVLIVAPHAVRHVRKKKIKPSDLFTGSLAYLLADLTGCHALALTKLYGGDPNYDKNCVFKDEIKRICSKYDIKLLLDLHGASATKEFDIDIGTMKGKSLLGQKKLKSRLEKSFKKCAITRISFDSFPAEKQHTVTRFASQELAIPALQIEINRKFRAPNQNGLPFNRVLAALASFISEV